MKAVSAAEKKKARPRKRARSPRSGINVDKT